MSPLSGTLVLDLTRVLSGPYCTMLLGDLGARVIKIERPVGGDDTRQWGPPFIAGESAYFLSINRNKESLTLDFQTPEGRAILDRLVGRADVVVENFRPGTLNRYGLDYASLAPRFPRLVYCSISGYGQSGPRRGLAGYDAVVQAEGGLMSVTGPPEGPPYRLGLPIADIVSGMFAAQGITAALLERERTGRGQHVDVALLDSVAALLIYHASGHLNAGATPGRFGNGHPSIVPYGTFPASDGPLMLAVGNDDQWRRLCDAAGLGEFARDARFATNPDRVRHRDVLEPMLAELLQQRTRTEWTRILAGAGVPCGEVRTVPEALADPQLEARGMIADMPHAAAGTVRAVNSPIKLSQHAPPTPLPPPTLGQHTGSILMGELGLTSEAIRDLRARNVI